MEQSNNSIDKLIKVLKEINNKEQTLDEVIEQIYQNNINKSFQNADKYIRQEIIQNKNFLEEIKTKIYRVEKKC